MSAPHTWSEGLQQQTRDAIESMMVSPISHCIHMKSTHGQYGTISAENMLRGNLDIDIVKGNTTHFDSLNDLLAAGWALD
jgi:hypothetical protein